MMTLPLNPTSPVSNCQFQNPFLEDTTTWNWSASSSYIYRNSLTHYHQSLFAISMVESNNQFEFQDHLPLIEKKLGGDGLIGELCKGFQLLMDGDKGVITFESLKNNSSVLGLHDLSDDDLLSMLREGDYDGDGALNQMEFCVLMFRLSPDLMEQSEFLLEEALEHEFMNSH